MQTTEAEACGHAPSRERPRLLAMVAMGLAALIGHAQERHAAWPLGILPPGEDMAPIPADSGLVMCSLRAGPAWPGRQDGQDAAPRPHLYWVPLIGGVPGLPALFSQSLSTAAGEGPAAFTDGGRTICFSMPLAGLRGAAGKAAPGPSGLFLAHREGERWSRPEPFTHNDPQSSAMHPAFSPDGLALYFASDRVGGHGGFDLYRCERTATGWSPPENLGPGVNGPEDELYPRMQADGTLHFSSKHPGGLGGLDIYSTREADGRWLPVRPMPAPVNSPANDHGYALMPDGRHALIASDRDGRSAIYRVDAAEPLFRDCALQEPDGPCFEISQRPLPEATMKDLEHCWDMGDGTLIRGYTARHCYTRPGRYTVRSLLLDRETSSIYLVLGSRPVVAGRIAQAWIDAPDTVRMGQRFKLRGSLRHVAGAEPVTCHWDLGQGAWGHGEEVVHAFMRPGVHEVRLDAERPSADGGAPAHWCSTRAIVVLEGLPGAAERSVTAVGDGASGKQWSFRYQVLPYDDLSLDAGAPGDAFFSLRLFASKERIALDDSRFRAIAKEGPVHERFDPAAGTYAYAVGEAKRPEELYRLFRKAKELQFLDAEVFMLSEEGLLDLSALDMARLADLDHRRLRTSAIRFGYKSAVLDASSYPVLDRIAAMMRKHAELRLVIEAHTDDVGSQQYNLDLSQQRALSVMDYLVDHGVLPDRMVPIGQGKRYPIASNATEEGRALNRRVEFRMAVPQAPAGGPGPGR